MKKFCILTKRNIKLYFNDKAMFLTSLITPAILLILFVTFLGNVYREQFLNNIPEGLEVSDKIINSLVSGQLISSLLAVSCVTVAFCSNFLMVQDKVSDVGKDIALTSVSNKILSLSYFVASLISTLIINFFALALCLIYVACTGWFMSVGDVLLIIYNVILLTLFGCVLSSLVNSLLTSQGQVSAVGSMISSMYGFLCGAYMPLSSFGVGLRNVLMFLPGTYGTSLLRNSTMNPAFLELAKVIPEDVVNVLKESFDCKLMFFDNEVSIVTMYTILISSIIILLILYILRNILKKEN